MCEVGSLMEQPFNLDQSRMHKRMAWIAHTILLITHTCTHTPLSLGQDSMFRVRLLYHESEPEIEAGLGKVKKGTAGRERQLALLLRQRVRTAVNKRQRCGLPNDRTTAYRLINR